MDLGMLPELLLPWYEQNKRGLPWRADRDPYHVWVSEIMLQQTRVEAVKRYYVRFLSELPDIPSLAACDDDRLQKLWEGLGYYSRVRNMKKAARILVDRYSGAFPSDFESIRALPGIGDYTAGAIASIALGLPTPAVDGNVLRVYARLTGCPDSVSKPETKRKVCEELRAVYPADACGTFTQALMELGAIICTPNGAPCCDRCPLCGICRSPEGELWKKYPVKDEKKPRRSEDKTVFILCSGGRYAIRKRRNSGLLAGLYEFPNAEGTLEAQDALNYVSALGCRPAELLKTQKRTHVFTHIEWHMTAYFINCRCIPEEFLSASLRELREDYSLPTAFRMFVEELL